MDARKIISVVCLSLFIVMFVHTITEHVHHDEDQTEFTSMHHHHCYAQEDEVLINFDNDVLNVLETLPCISFTLSIEALIPQTEIELPFSRMVHHYGGVPLPDEPYAQSLGFRAPPVAAIA